VGHSAEALSGTIQLMSLGVSLSAGRADKARSGACYLAPAIVGGRFAPKPAYS